MGSCDKSEGIMLSQPRPPLQATNVTRSCYKSEGIMLSPPRPPLQATNVTRSCDKSEGIMLSPPRPPLQATNVKTNSGKSEGQRVVAEDRPEEPKRKRHSPTAEMLKLGKARLQKRHKRRPAEQRSTGIEAPVRTHLFSSDGMPSIQPHERVV